MLLCFNSFEELISTLCYCLNKVPYAKNLAAVVCWRPVDCKHISWRALIIHIAYAGLSVSEQTFFDKTTTCSMQDSLVSSDFLCVSCGITRFEHCVYCVVTHSSSAAVSHHIWRLQPSALSPLQSALCSHVLESCGCCSKHAIAEQDTQVAHVFLLYLPP
jgi:hypothetical protein